MTAGDEPAVVERPASALEVLRQRDFGIYFVGNSLSSIGTWFQNLAAALLVFDLTGSTLLVGVVNFAQFVGAFLFAGVAGNAADRFDRRKLLIVTQLGAAAVSGALAVLAATGDVSAGIVIVAAALLGLSLAFMVPALLSLVPLLVPRRDLETAVSLNSITFNLARAIGPVLGAAVIAAFGYAPAFAVNAVSFLIFVIVLTRIEPRPQEIAVGARPRLRDSLRMVSRDPVLRALLLVVMAVSTTTDPVNTLTPEFAKEVLGGGDAVVGFLVGSFGAGATLTAVFLTPWIARRRNALVGAMLVEGGGMLLLAVAPNLAVALLALMISGGGFIAAITRSTTRIQSEVADAELGRVMALWSLAFIGTRPFAALLDGAVADAFGARVGAAVMALPVLVAAPLVLRLIRRRRGEAADQSASGGSSDET